MMLGASAGIMIGASIVAISVLEFWKELFKK